VTTEERKDYYESVTHLRGDKDLKEGKDFRGVWV